MIKKKSQVGPTSSSPTLTMTNDYSEEMYQVSARVAKSCFNLSSCHRAFVFVCYISCHIIVNTGQRAFFCYFFATGTQKLKVQCNHKMLTLSYFHQITVVIEKVI